MRTIDCQKVPHVLAGLGQTDRVNFGRWSSVWHNERGAIPAAGLPPGQTLL
jgi:hypothetical protein